jgi:hypothetical protein
MPVDMKEAYDFTMQLRGMVPGPHRIRLANPELSKTVVAKALGLTVPQMILARATEVIE